MSSRFQQYHRVRICSAADHRKYSNLRVYRLVLVVFGYRSPHVVNVENSFNKVCSCDF
jgi:hypothetical protein